MLACGYARLRKHAIHTLDTIQQRSTDNPLWVGGVIVPESPDAEVAAAVSVYRGERPVDGLPVTDAMLAARRQGPAPEDVGAGSTAPPPDYAEVEEYAF